MAASQGSISVLFKSQWTSVMPMQTHMGGATPEGHDAVAALRLKRQELLEEVGKMQVRGCA